MPQLQSIKKIVFMSGFLLFFAALGVFSFSQQQERESLIPLRASSCTLPSVVTTTIELTPMSADNVIDCTGQDIVIQSGGKVITKPYVTANNQLNDDGGVLLKVNSLTIDVGGEFSASGQGYSAGALDGNSATASTGIAGGSGGGNGGAGGAANPPGEPNVVGTPGTPSLGDKYAPIYLGGAGSNAGGGGAGGSGGGALHIQATATVTINGKISADGVDGVKSSDGQSSGGGGAGGSIWVEADILAGAGQVTAKGGGTDQTAAYFGGGGGGGRVVMVCLTSISFPVANVDYGYGLGSQNGQPGSLVGPGCKPAAPTTLRFYEKNATAGKVDKELSVTDTTTKTALTFASDLAGTNLYLEIEVRQKDQPFQNVKTKGQVTAASNKTCTGIPTGTGIVIGTYCGYVEETTGLVVSTQYKWQGRIVSALGVASNWVEYGGNATTDFDFTIVGPPVGLVILEGNNQSVTVGQQTPIKPKVRVVDAAGFGYPNYAGYTWSVLSGGGTVANGTTTANQWGEMTVDWTVGQLAGIENNSIKIARSSAPAMSATFVASALPGAIASYTVNAPSTFVVVNNQFSYTIIAKDLYGNIVPFTDNLSISPVTADDVSVPGLGTLTPEQVVITGSPTNSSWYYTGWNYRKKVTFSNIQATLGVPATDLIDFPVLLKLTAANIDFSQIRSDGADLRFTDNDGATPLSYEIETWDYANQIAYIWVKIPKINSGSTTDGIYLYYGNATAVPLASTGTVWNSDFALVQHLNEASGTVSYDATANALNGTRTSTGEPTATVGKFAGAQQFDGVNDNIRFAHNSLISYGAPSASFTLEAWVKTTSLNTAILAKARPSANTHMEYYLLVRDGKIMFNRLYNSVTYPAGLDTVTSNALINDGQWHHVVFVSSAADKHEIWIDGSKDITDTKVWSYTDSTTQSFDIGKYDNYNFSDEFFLGTLDEVRLSKAARTESWIAATYKTESEVFNAYGLQEVNPGAQSSFEANGSSGTITVPNALYTYSQNIKIKVQDTNGKVGYSNAVLFVPAVGTCPAITIDVDQTWSAVDVPNGIYDCRGLGTFRVVGTHTLTLTPYTGGDADWSNDFGVTILADAFSIEPQASIISNGSVATYRAGTHGGYSGQSPYGSVFEPTAFGGAGHGSCSGYGPGGGAVKLVTTGSFALNGTISMNGGAPGGGCPWYSGGGAGGSIWIDTQTMSGSGLLRANGASGGNGHGAGGRIAVYYTTNTDFLFNNSHVQAFGATTATGPGTIYVEQRGVHSQYGGILIVDNNGTAGNFAGVMHGNYSFTEVRVTNNGHVEFMDDGGTSTTESAHSKLTITNGNSLVGDASKPEIKISGTLQYSGAGALSINGITLGINGKAAGVGDVNIAQTLNSGLKLYAETWFHSKTNPYVFGNVQVNAQGTITMIPVNGSGVFANLSNLTIAPQGFVVSDGSVSTYNGGAHGGYSESAPYGDLYEPVTLGGAGHGSCSGYGAGGGAMKLTISGTLTNNGTMSVNGGSPGGGCPWYSGGGAGGSIWIDTGTLTGTGIIRANGASGGNGHGAGGRIAVYYTTNTDFVFDKVHIQSFGATTATGPGTIYVEQRGVHPIKSGLLLIDNNGTQGGYAGAVHGNYSFTSVRVTNYGHIEFMDNGGTNAEESAHSSVTLTSGSGFVGDNTKPEIKITGTLRYTGTGALSINGVSLGLNGKTVGIGDINIAQTLNSGLILYAQTWYHNKTNPYSFGNVVVNSAGTVTIVPVNNVGGYVNLTSLNVATSALVHADALSSYYGGGAHGGYSQGTPYGSVYEPETMGGAGHGSCSSYGPGGGAMKLTISGELTVNGTISVNGGVPGGGCPWYSGGGAGGSIWIDTQTISGTGFIKSNGATGGDAHGAGGRIAVYYTTNTDFVFNNAHIQAFGSATSTGAGTIYVEQRGVHAVKSGLLVVDNNGVQGGYAGVVHGNYSFAEVRVTQYGHVEFMDNGGSSATEADHSSVTLTSGTGFSGDNTKPEIKITGTLQYTGVGALSINGVSLGINGKVVGVGDIVIGNTLNSGLNLYSETWYHNKTVPYQFENVLVNSLGVVKIIPVNDKAAYVQMSSLTVATSALIHSDALASYYGAGAHGGYSAGTPYGSVYQPETVGGAGWGSCSGYGPGGGAMKLTISGALLLNGTISVNGGSPGGGCPWYAGGGAGGSIWIDTASIAGSGAVKANGAGGGNAHGSGGRIAVYYTNNIDFVTDSVHLQAFGATTATGPGTIYVEQRGVHAENNGILMVDNNGTAGGFAGVLHGDYQFSEIRTSRYGHVEFMDNGGSSTTEADHSSLTISSGSGFVGDNTKPEVKITGTLKYTGVTQLSIDGISLGVNGKMIGIDDLDIGQTLNSGLTLYAETWFYNSNNPYIFGDVRVSSHGTVTLIPVNESGVFTTMNSLFVDTTALVTANGLAATYKGGAHGGYAEGVPYGDLYEPVSLGGAGHGSCSGYGAGGGAMKLTVNGELTNNGTITANGAAPGGGCPWYSGGGAGGSIWIDTLTLSGTGLIRANGVAGGNANGAGGRIAVYYETNTGFVFDTTHIQAFGSAGTGPGTVYIEQKGVHRTKGGNLIVNNNDVAGHAADFLAQTYKFNDVFIGKNITIWLQSDTTYTDQSGKVVGKGAFLDITGNFTLDVGSSLLGIGEGFGSDAGFGKGLQGVGYSGGSGGGNGGFGGDGQSDGANPAAKGGSFYGDQLIPLTLGSGGGSSAVGALGGAGGSAFGVYSHEIEGSEALRGGNIAVFGTINVNGESGKTGSPGGGGGAGGSILLWGNSCDVTGTLLAKGGEGGNSDVDGGTGGGGHISILYSVGPCTVSGTVSVDAGAPTDPLNYSASLGQVGTYPSEPNSVPWPSQYKEQFELRETTGSVKERTRLVAQRVTVGDVLGITESVIPIGGVINGTTVTLKADAFDAGARAITPKNLKIQVELKKVGEVYDGATGILESQTVSFSGGAPVILSVTATNLEMGASYRWRVRTVSIDNSLVSEWREFGGNPASEADFTITTVASLEAMIAKPTIEISETDSITVSALDSNGNPDTSYVGTVQFTTESTSAQLPATYTFTATDAGVHTFTDEIKYFETGTFSITVADTVNPALQTTVSVTVRPADIPNLIFSANPTSIHAGETTQLEWQSAFVNNLSIDQGIGSVNASGIIGVSPVTNTTYTISGTTKYGEQIQATVAISIIPPDVPSLQITATLQEIPYGSNTTIQWQSAYVTNLQIDNGLGPVVGTGEMLVYPTSTTTYTVSGTTTAGNPISDSVTIVVLAADQATLSLGASSLTIISGQSTTLLWASAQVNSLLFNNGLGAVGASGQRIVSPTSTTTYVLQGTKTSGGTTSASVTITVLSPDVPALTINAVPVEVVPGGAVTLNWRSQHVNSLALDNGIGAVSSQGNVIVYPKVTTTYVISGTSTYGVPLSAYVTVRVALPGPQLIVGAQPTSITLGDNSVLHWQSKEVVSITIDHEIGKVELNGQMEVWPTATTTYHFTAVLADGSKLSAMQTITVLPKSDEPQVCPVIELFTASEYLIRNEKSITLQWKVTGVSVVSIDALADKLPAAGSGVMVLSSTKDITITADNGKCQQVMKIHVEVVPFYPWEGAGGLLIGVAALEVLQGNIWFALLGFIDRAKKRKPWGVVYDSVSKKLLSRVTLRLYDTLDGHVVDTVVSDAQGVFRFAPKSGSYIIKAKLTGYIFPSTVINTKEDGGFTNIYRGEVVVVSANQELIALSIPLDPTEIHGVRPLINRVLNAVRATIDILNPIVLAAGCIYSLIVTIMYPIAFNVAILALYALVLCVKMVGYINRKRMFGTVIDSEGKVVSGLEIGIFDKDFNTLVAHTFTNHKGNYNFVIQNRDYMLKVMDTRFKMLRRQSYTDSIFLQKETNNSAVRLISENIIVYHARS